MKGPVQPDSHQQNAITWFSLGIVGFTVSMLVGGVSVIAALVTGFVALGIGGVELYRHRQAKATGKIRRKPSLKKRLRKQSRDIWHGKPQGGKADYRLKNPKLPKSPQPETTPRGKCSVRCRRSVNPVETCECVCKGERHGTET